MSIKKFSRLVFREEGFSGGARAHPGRNREVLEFRGKVVTATNVFGTRQIVGSIFLVVAWQQSERMNRASERKELVRNRPWVSQPRCLVAVIGLKDLMKRILIGSR